MAASRQPARPPGAVVLLSGGLDSAVTLALALALDSGRRPHCLTFDYGQRHRFELDAASRLARAARCDHRLIRVDLRAIGGSALTDDIDVPKGRSDDDIAHGVPITYVPARNLIFLSLGAAYAETIDADEIHLGVNAIDYSGYTDCRPDFIAAFERAANLATRRAAEGSPVRIVAPLAAMSKADIVRAGARLGVDFGLTHSCYDPDESGGACGACDACAIRRRGFEESGIADPTRYAAPRADSARVPWYGA